MALFVVAVVRGRRDSPGLYFFFSELSRLKSSPSYPSYPKRGPSVLAGVAQTRAPARRQRGRLEPRRDEAPGNSGNSGNFSAARESNQNYFARRIERTSEREAAGECRRGVLRRAFAEEIEGARHQSDLELIGASGMTFMDRPKTDKLFAETNRTIHGFAEDLTNTPVRQGPSGQRDIVNRLQRLTQGRGGLISGLPSGLLSRVSKSSPAADQRQAGRRTPSPRRLARRTSCRRRRKSRRRHLLLRPRPHSLRIAP